MTKTVTVEVPVYGHPSVLKRIQEILRVQSADRPRLVTLVERRLSSRAIDALRQCSLTDEEIYSLVLPRRMLTHRRATCPGGAAPAADLRGRRPAPGISILSAVERRQRHSAWRRSHDPDDAYKSMIRAMTWR